MEIKHTIKKIYEGKEHTIILNQNREGTEILCKRDNKYYKTIINLKTNYFYLNPFEEIVSEFENNKIEIKSPNNDDELMLKIRKNFSIKNTIPPYLSNPKKIMEKERYEIELFFLETKNIYISVKDKDSHKKFCFKLESKEAIKEVDEMLDNFKELIIDGGKLELKKELDSVTLNMEYTFSSTLKFERKVEQFIFEINELYEEIRKLEIELDKDKQNENQKKKIIIEQKKK